MTDFTDQFDDTELMLALGDDISYAPAVGGGPFSIKAIVDFDVEFIGNEGRTVETRTEIEFIKSEIPVDPVRNDVITHNSKTYKVHSPVSDDGVYVRVAVK